MKDKSNIQNKLSSPENPREQERNRITPFHLKEHTKSINRLDGFMYGNWFETLSWKGLLNTNDDDFFCIYFEGIQCKDGFVTNEENCPLRIFAQNHDSEKILLFDEEIHGYTPLLIEKKIFPNHCNEKLYLDKNGNLLFNVIIWTNSSIDFDDEFPDYKLLNGENVNLEFLKSNAFDAFGIILRNINGEYITLTEIELC